MNEVVKDTLELRGDNMSLYALKRIEELEEKLQAIDKMLEIISNQQGIPTEIGEVIQKRFMDLL